MSDIYVMQRANGDLFALDHHGRFGVPLFSNSSDAMIARSHNFEMLLFKPVALNATLLSELVPAGSEADVDLWLIEDPSMSLKRGRLVDHAQLALLLGTPFQPQFVMGKGNGPVVPALKDLPQRGGSSTETSEHKEGKTQSVREVAMMA